MQCFIKSALPAFQDTTSDRRIKAVVRVKLVSLHENDNREPVRAKTPVWQASEKFVRPVAAWDAVSNVSPMKADIRAQPWDFH